MNTFNVTMEVVRGEHSYTEEYDLTVYSDSEILEYRGGIMRVKFYDKNKNGIEFGASYAKVNNQWWRI